ncbi:hypothetical protein GIB67_008999 [Kingdonia uniflora]|uniref:RNase H type-1 domain-containing protein n=1 Tax=Kingdonia uniflora TaxID=39325 RepID=A0A7J7LVN5_9MAGN|nr:hypothetical protein GIB67_008999 [Kingdonia uniflora]
MDSNQSVNNPQLPTSGDNNDHNDNERAPNFFSENHSENWASSPLGNMVGQVVNMVSNQVMKELVAQAQLSKIMNFPLYLRLLIAQDLLFPPSTGLRFLELHLRLRKLKVGCKYRKYKPIKSCSWKLLEIGETKICCDGSCRGNPGVSGMGVIFKSCDGSVKGTLSKAIGIMTNFLSEIQEMIDGAQKAIQNNWFSVWFVYDYKVAIQAFLSNKIPWKFKVQWDKLRSKFFQHQIQCSYARG